MAFPVLIIPALLEASVKVIERLFPDPEQAAQAKLKLFEMEKNGELASLAADTEIAKSQAEINSIEAASDSKFKSWWRPAVGWICVVGLGYQFLLRPLLILGLVLSGITADFAVFDLDVATLGTLLFGLLGLGTLRTWEKRNGMAR